ncbi:MAG: Flp pilus assembly protein CpaB [Pseudomonadota bacterium]
MRIVILVFSLAAAGGAGWMTMKMNGRDLGSQTTEIAPQVIPKKDVLVAIAAIPAGEVLTTEKLRWQAWPEPQLSDQFILHEDQPEALTELAGSFVNRAFAPGEPVREDRLMETNANLLSNKIASGMRAAAVKITAENTAGGFILPGDRVDVIHTVTQVQDKGDTKQNESKIIISNARVLAIDQTAVQSPEGSAIGKTATLELSPDEVERVMAAEASGMLSLALRAVTDHDSKDVPEAPREIRTVRIHRATETTTVTLR